MKVLFNYDLKNSLQMLEKMKEWITIPEIYESNMEDSYYFKFDNVNFYITYDRNSEKNKLIYKFIIESLAESNCEGTDKDKETSKQIYNNLKNNIKNIIIEDDDLFD